MPVSQTQEHDARDQNSIEKQKSWAKYFLSLQMSLAIANLVDEAASERTVNVSVPRLWWGQMGHPEVIRPHSGLMPCGSSKATVVQLSLPLGFSVTWALGSKRKCAEMFNSQLMWQSSEEQLHVLAATWKLSEERSMQCYTGCGTGEELGDNAFWASSSSFPPTAALTGAGRNASPVGRGDPLNQHCHYRTEHILQFLGDSGIVCCYRLLYFEFYLGCHFKRETECWKGEQTWPADLLRTQETSLKDKPHWGRAGLLNSAGQWLPGSW